MPATLKIERARFVLTLDPARRILRDATILVEDGHIARVSSATELAGVPADRVLDAREMVVAPGLVNGHLHVSYAHAVRGIFPDSLDPLVYLGHVFRLQGAMTEEEEYHTTLLALTEVLRYGTTCVLDPGTTRFPDACLDAWDRAGCRIVMGTQLVDRPNRLGLPVMPTADALALAERTLRTFDGRLGGRVRAWVMPFSAEAASLELLQGARALADRYGTGLTLHQTSTGPAVQAWMERHGRRPVESLAEWGLLGPRVLLAHVIDLDDREVDALARTGAGVAIAPPAALKMGTGTSRRGKLPELLARGVPVALATDAANNSNLLDTHRALYLAAVLYKDARESTAVIPAETALELATITGARALGLDGEIGSIEPGKRADLVLYDTRRPEWRSLFDPVNALVYAADGRSVHTVVVDGRLVVEAGRPTFVDEDRLIDTVQELGERLLRRTGVSFPPRWPVV